MLTRKWRDCTEFCTVHGNTAHSHLLKITQLQWKTLSFLQLEAFLCCN